MTNHDVYWPEMGIEGEESVDESDETVREWLERPVLRKILLTIYLGSEVTRIVSLGAIASGLLVAGAHVGIDFSSNTAIVWGFVGAVTLVMSADELSKRTTEYSVQYGAFLASTIVVVSLVRIYLKFEARRDSIDDPSTLTSSLPIESIPILELYKRRNRLI